jgi:phage terminase large subunit-like protein
VAQTLGNMSVPTKDFLSRISTHDLRHDGNPVLRWAASNLSLYYKGTVPNGEDVLEYLDKVPVMPSKRTSADKIDPVTATILALGRYSVNPHPQEAWSGTVEVF